MAGNSHDDETPAESTVGNVGNRSLLLVLGNYVVEAREHGARLEKLYHTLRELPHAAPGHFGEQLLQEQERHHSADEEHLFTLRHLVRGT